MLRALNALMAALFLVSAALQHNDPDPARWVAIYGGAAAACVAHGLSARGHDVAPGARSRRPWAAVLAGAVGLVALVWCASIAPEVIGKVAPADLFESMQAKDGLVEVARESGGLAIVAAWMGVLVGSAIVGRRTRDGTMQG